MVRVMLQNESLKYLQRIYRFTLMKDNSNKKKYCIWIINNTAGSPEHGMVYRNFYIAKNLMALGHEVLIISSTFNHQFYKYPPDSEVLNYSKVQDVPFCWIKTNPYKGNGFGRLKAIVMFAYLYRKLFKKIEFTPPDVVIASSPTPMLGVSAIDTKKYFKSKIIFEIRDLWPLTLISVGGMSKYNPFVVLMGFLEKLSYKNSDHIVSVLSEAYEYLKSHNIAKDNFTCIPNGYEMNSVAYAEDVLPPEYAQAFTGADFYLVYTGAHGVANNLDNLIDAARLILDLPIKILLIGDGQEKQRLIDYAQGLDNIIFLDFVPKEQVASILKQADACYFGVKKITIYKYGMSPNKIFDYMFAEKPIICVAETKNSVVELSGCGFMVEPENPTKLAETIRNIFLMKKEDRSEIGLLGKNYLLDNHMYSVLAKKYEELISKMMTEEVSEGMK